MNLTKLLKTLADEAGVSGEENRAASLAAGYLKKYTRDVQISHGNVLAHFGTREENKPHVVLDAHIDQIGFVVTYITDEGFIKVGNCGGIDRRLLAAQPVTVYGKRELPGVITSTPPHLASDKDKKVPEIGDIAIDTGMRKEELEKLVEPGDKIRFDTRCKELLGKRLTGGALDDRAGVAAILYAVDLLKERELSCSYTVLFSTQEEIGERGAHIGAYTVNADIAIAVDVGFGWAEGEDESKCGKLGKGGMVGISPSLDRALSEELIHLAQKEKIPYQLEVMPGLTSTNADQFAVSRGGARTVTLSIPLRYMHTPVEVIHLSDVKNVGKLLAEYILRAGSKA